MTPSQTLFFFPAALIKVMMTSPTAESSQSSSHSLQLFHVGMFIASLKRNLKQRYAPCREALALIQSSLENTGGRKLFIFSVLQKLSGDTMSRDVFI